MRLHRFDLNRLAALDALLSECSVSRAAARLHLSQPAMSGALASLRDYFGDPLLVSVGRSMRRTSFAETLVQPVRDVLRQVEHITHRRPSLVLRDMQRTVSIAASDLSATLLLPALVREARQVAPGLRFELRPVTPFLSSDLERGELDMILGPDLIVAPNHPIQSLFSAPYACLVCRSSRLAWSTLDLETYMEAEHVAVKWWNGVLPVDEVALRAAHVRRKIPIAVPAFSLFPLFLAGTDRIATLPLQMARVQAADFSLALRPCPAPVAPLAYCVQWQTRQDADPAITWIRTRLKAASDRLSPQRPPPIGEPDGLYQ